MHRDSAAEPAPSNITRETFNEHYGAWMEAKRIRETAVAKERSALKAAETAGINIKAMKANEKERADGNDAVLAFEKAKAQQRVWMGLPVFTQTDLFGQHVAPQQTPSEEISAEFAKQAGWESGKSGGLRDDNPFAAGTMQYVEWDSGYMDGQAAIAEGMKPKTRATKPSEERKPANRGRRMN